MKRTLRFTTMLSVAALALSIPMRSAFAAAPPDSTTVPKLLDQVKHHAAEANYDAEILNSLRHSNVDFRTYGQVLNNIKTHANDLFQDYYELQRQRDSGTPAQREAIDKLEPLLREMATSLTNTFQKLDAHQTGVNTPEFRKGIRENWEKINVVYQHLCKCTEKQNKI